MSIYTRFFDLFEGEENKSKVIENVKSNISFKGANLWILACAIIIASVGLNVNSTAVIIGAMLISPLMGPIVGAGFALGMYDFELLKRSLKNLLIATVVSLVVSSVFFYLSPFKETQSELLARTSPNIYDVLIAFFGGVVGVIAVTRVEKGNPIPGVAIATALMPPLCTAGYGLALGNFKFFFGALFLYTINCVFICIATFAIIKYLKYPSRTFVDERKEKMVRYGISAIITIVLVPSVYFAYQLYGEQTFKQKIEDFINAEFVSKGNTIIFKKSTYQTQPKTIELAFLTRKFEPKEIKILNQRLVSFGLNNTQLIIRQDSIDLKTSILNEINQGNKELNEKEQMIKKLNHQLELDKFNNDELLSEIQIWNPSVKSVSLANHYYHENTDSAYFVTVAMLQVSKKLDNESNQKIKNWLSQRLHLKQVLIFQTDK